MPYPELPRTVGCVVALAALGALGCGPRCEAWQKPPEMMPIPADEGPLPPEDSTALFIQIEGPLDELRELTRLRGLEMGRGVHDLGCGRWRAGAYVKSRKALAVVRARGLAVRVTLDEAETERRMRGERR